MSSLVVLAAGMGSRFGGLKQLEPVGASGEFILDYSVFDALGAGFQKAVFVIRRDIEDLFREKVGKSLEQRIDVRYVFQEKGEGREKPWGTGHAVLCARGEVDDNFAVVNADDFYGKHSFRLLGSFLEGTDPKSSRWALAAFSLGKTLSDSGGVSRGVCQVGNGKLKSVREHTGIQKDADGLIVGVDPEGERVTLSEETPVSMNMWAFTPVFFDVLEKGFAEFCAKNSDDAKAEYYLPAAVDEEIKAGRAEVLSLQTPENWMGITNPDDLKAIREGISRKVSEGVYGTSLWS